MDVRVRRARGGRARSRRGGAAGRRAAGAAPRRRRAARPPGGPRAGRRRRSGRGSSEVKIASGSPSAMIRPLTHTTHGRCAATELSSCVVSTIVMPSRLRSASRCRMSSRVLMSTPLVGSSSSSRSGSPTSARARKTRCCWPPDRLADVPVAQAADAEPLEQPVDPRLIGPARPWHATAGSTSGPSARPRGPSPGSSSRPSRAAAPSRRWASSRSRPLVPPTVTRPATRGTAPTIARSSVVLPAPDGPTMPDERAARDRRGRRRAGPAAPS